MCTRQIKTPLKRQIQALKRLQKKFKPDIDQTKPYIDQCKELFQKHPSVFGRLLMNGYKLYELDQNCIPPYKYLVDWINSQTPLLQDPVYGFSTKLYWIFNNMTDFKVCQLEGCKNKIGVRQNVKINKGYHNYCCNNHAQQDQKTIDKVKKTKKERYNDEKYVNIEQIKKTNVQRYGVECTWQAKQVKEKIKEKREKSIQENPNYWKDRDAKSKETKVLNGHDPNWVNKEKTQQTRKENLDKDPHYYDDSYVRGVNTSIERYGGVFNPKKSKETKERHKQEDPNYQKKITEKKLATRSKNHPNEPNYVLFGSPSFYIRNEELHGDPYWHNQKQIEQTCIDRYGHPVALQWGSKEFKQRMIKKYGVEHNSQVHEFRIKQTKTYVFDNKTFASAWELSLYLYLKDNKILFDYQPKIQFEYFHNKKKHYYEPDFIINGEIIEIKGNHFFENKDPTKKMICPYRNKNWSDESYQLECQKYEAKHQCMLKNNVKIYTEEDCLPFLNYVIQVYGHDFLSKCKKNNLH